MDMKIFVVCRDNGFYFGRDFKHNWWSFNYQYDWYDLDSYLYMPTHVRTKNLEGELVDFDWSKMI